MRQRERVFECSGLYREKIVYVLCRVINSKHIGLENVWHRQDIPTRADCGLRNGYEPVQLNSVTVPVYAFALGLSAFISILILERSMHYWFQHKQHGGLKASVNYENG